MMDDILFAQQSHLGVITLNRTSALHALTLPMIQAMSQQLLVWEKDASIHAVVVQAAPGKAFCAGGDVRWLYDMGRTQFSEQRQFFWHEYRLNYLIHRYSKPYIALMDGMTMGGGVGISLHGSHPVATERFLFAMPETSIGFFPDIGASYLLARCPDSYGVYLGLTGNRLTAADCMALKLVHQVISSECIETLKQALLAEDLSRADAHQRVSACIKQFAIATEETLMPQTVYPMSHFFDHTQIETILGVLAEAHDDWCYEIKTNLLQKSPLSLKVTLKQLQQAKAQNFSQCLQTDYALVQHFMQGFDFYEGVRALLVDKDKAPQWHPKTLAEVSLEQIVTYFSQNTTEQLSLAL